MAEKAYAIRTYWNGEPYIDRIYKSLNTAHGAATVKYASSPSYHYNWGTGKRVPNPNAGKSYQDFDIIEIDITAGTVLDSVKKGERTPWNDPAKADQRKLKAKLARAQQKVADLTRQLDSLA